MTISEKTREEQQFQLSDVFNHLNPVARVVITATVPVILTVIFVRIVMSPLFLQIEYNRPGFPVDPYGFTTEDRLRYAPASVKYLLNDADISFLADLRLPREIVPVDVCNIAPEDASLCLMYNERELRHMEDVKVVTRGTYRFGVAASIAGVISIVFLFRRDRWLLKQSLIGGALLTFGIIGTIVLLAVTAWDVFFTGFHNLFFEGDSWLFRYSDTLIRLFPEQFWFDAAFIVGTFTALSAALILFLALRWHPLESEG